MSTPNPLETTRLLRVVYTDPERLELGKQLGDHYAELRQVNADFDRINNQMKSKITALEAKIDDESNKVSTGYRYEEVKCRWLMDHPWRGTKNLLRNDTGETVESASMTAEDRQQKLDLDEPTDKGHQEALEKKFNEPKEEAAATD